MIITPSMKSGTRSTTTAHGNTWQQGRWYHHRLGSHLSPTMTMSSSMKSCTMHTTKIHGNTTMHVATAEGGYHHEPMNKMIKKTSETLSNKLQSTKTNYHIYTSYSILASHLSFRHRKKNLEHIHSALPLQPHSASIKAVLPVEWGSGVVAALKRPPKAAIWPTNFNK
jgi:hypothetical protein